MANKKLLQITDNGPVKVLGTGTNGWTEKWGNGNYHHPANWPMWKDFPTAVQVGDLIWVMKDSPYISSGDFVGERVARWTLAGINVTEGGTNVAYPSVTNNVITGDSNALYQTARATREPLSNPTYYLNITTPDGVAANSNNLSSAMLSYTGYQSDRAYPQFTGSNVTHYFTRNIKDITATNAATGDGDYVHGLGWVCTPIGASYTAALMFPPIRYKWQFEELYGKETDWAVPQDGYEIWKDGAPSGTTQ